MADPRACFEGVLWILRSGARWKDLPPRFSSYATCWRRFVEWTDNGALDKAWARLLRKLDKSGRVDWSEGFADGTFASAKKGVIVLAIQLAIGNTTFLDHDTMMFGRKQDRFNLLLLTQPW